MIFIYITSLASNEIFEFTFIILLIRITIITCLIIFLYFLDKTFFIPYLINYEANLSRMENNIIFENSLILNKLYNYPINIITITLMGYLFLTLIAAVKLTNIFEGPLRPKY